MRIGGSGTIEVNVLPSGGGTMRGNDLVSERDGWLISPWVNVGNLASNFSCIQLLNAAGSGRRLLVDMMLIQNLTTDRYHLRSHGTELTTDIGAWSSLNPGAAAGNAHVFTDQVTSEPGDLIIELSKLSSSAKEVFYLPFPIMLDEGEGLVILPNATASLMRAQFIGREV